jgi:hypothetical protein
VSDAEKRDDAPGCDAAAKGGSCCSQTPRCGCGQAPAASGESECCFGESPGRWKLLALVVLMCAVAVVVVRGLDRLLTKGAPAARPAATQPANPAPATQP